MEDSQKRNTTQKKPDSRVYNIVLSFYSYKTLGKINLISGYKTEIMVDWN